MTIDGPDLSDDEHRRLAAEMYERWQGGEKKSPLEIEYWGDATSHGKHFTSYTKRWPGVTTETKSSQTQHIERLEGLLRSNGISPTDAGDLDEHFRLLAKARESALSALRGYNDPLAGFRTEAFGEHRAARFVAEGLAEHGGPGPDPAEIDLGTGRALTRLAALTASARNRPFPVVDAEDLSGGAMTVWIRPAFVPEADLNERVLGGPQLLTPAERERLSLPEVASP